jgi:hypothetical protein
MATGDVSVLRLIGRYQEQNIVNTLHYFHAEQVSSEIDVLDSLVTGWEVSHDATWVARHCDSYTLIGIKAFRTTGDPKVPFGTRLDHAGTVVGTEELSSVGRTITFYTNSANHRRHGRLMLSGGTNDMFVDSDGSVDTIEGVAMQALGDELLAELFSGGDEFKLCIPPTDTLPYEIITAARARSTPASIRSRRIKRFYIG